MPKLSPEDLAGAEVIGKLSPEDLKGAERVSKYPAPKSFSADDQALGDVSGPVKTEGLQFSKHLFGLAPHEVNVYDAMSPAEQENFKRVRDDAGRAFISEVGGQVVGSAVVPVGEGIGAPIGRKIIAGAPALAGKVTAAAKGAMPNTVAYMEKAIEHSQHELGKLGAAPAIGKDVAAMAKRAGSATASVAGTVAPVVAAQAGGAAATSGPISNAVERLRASAGVHPRAAELLSKIEATQQPPFPAPVATGTVSQGTLGGHE